MEINVKDDKGNIEYLGTFANLEEAKAYWTSGDPYLENLVYNDKVEFIIIKP